MHRISILTLALAALLAATAAQATPTLIAIGTLGGTSDLSGLTGTLENGLAANVLGGLGSGLAWAGGNTFTATPDRGPNATPYNSGVDDTTSYISRFQTLKLDLVAAASGNLPYTLPPSPGAPAQNTANAHHFSGRSDNFDASKTSANLNNARLDPEAVRVSKDGKSVFISNEYGPYIYQFDRATGRRIKSFTLPANLAITHLSAQGSGGNRRQQYRARGQQGYGRPGNFA